MKKFKFATNKKIIEEIVNNARQFIYIVNFQFTDDSFIRKLLLDKAGSVELSIITLPSDSYKDLVERDKIDELYKDLERKGAKVYRCMWEVGDPSLTATSLSGEQLEGGGNKWYSMHGKFIVTDNHALIMSSNFTDAEEIEDYLLISEKNITNQFIKKFQQLKSLFIEKKKLYPGKIFDLLDNESKNYIKDLFKISKRLNIKAYSPKLTPLRLLTDGLYITPFDGRARNFLNSFIDDAQKFLYFSTERFFDDMLVKRLATKAINTNVKIRLITCPPKQIRQNPDKAEQMISELLSAGIEIKFFENIHAKCWISDKFLSIGSVNLGKMNLGFRKTGNFWRANTETIYFDSDKKIIKEAKSEFESIFIKGDEPLKSIALSSKYLNNTKILFSIFGMRSDGGARDTMSQVQIIFKINSRRDLLKVINLAVKIAKKFGLKIITRKEVLMALILFCLTERKHTFNELLEKLKPIIEKKIEIEQILTILIKGNFIVKQENFYKINIESVFR